MAEDSRGSSNPSGRRSQGRPACVGRPSFLRLGALGSPEFAMDQPRELPSRPPNDRCWRTAGFPNPSGRTREEGPWSRVWPLYACTFEVALSARSSRRSSRANSLAVLRTMGHGGRPGSQIPPGVHKKRGHGCMPGPSPFYVWMLLHPLQFAVTQPANCQAVRRSGCDLRTAGFGRSLRS